MKSEVNSSMDKEWFSAKELIHSPGLPSSTQGINQMARRQGWKHRRRLGVQGKALEYHIDSLPKPILKQLRLNEEAEKYSLNQQDPFTIWIEAYRQLTDSEREKLIAFLFREGIQGLIKRLSND